MLQYALLHLSGYDLPMEEIKKFRQLHSKTPGHPEYGYTAGIETTTGPLGQGIANAVGMALAEKILATHFNKPGHEIIDHHTYVFLGDGCLMEGISHEACAFAGTLGLGKLIAFWDDNGISIDGHVEGWFTDNTPKRFEAYGWRVIAGVDGHNADQIKQAIEEAQQDPRPTLICCKTVIGFGSPNKANSHECHGSPLGPEEIAASRKQLGWNHPAFEIPRDIYAGWDAKAKGHTYEAAWKKRWDAYQSAFPKEAAELERRLLGEFPDEWELTCAKALVDINQKAETIASRKASQNAINALAPMMPEFLGGSADLTGSNLTNAKNAKWITPTDFTGNYISYGVREFGMAAMMNGMALHGGFIPFGGTFLVFTDYMRNAMRLSALMKQRVIYVLTHDSIGLGEDGPTHQPVEHVSSLRLIPNMSVWRPCDAVETFVSWQTAVERIDGPTSLILSRQNLPHQVRTPEALGNVVKGGYTLHDCDSKPQVILLATGSEIGIVVDAAKTLTAQGKKVRVVSMPCVDLFDKQSESYRQTVLIPGVPVVAIEAGVTSYWHKFVGLTGKVLGIDTFGESAPAGTLYKHFGLTAEKVVTAAESLL
jgi:transketolase